MDFRKPSSTEKYKFRKREIILIKSGEKQKEVAELFGVRENTVSNWKKAYNSDGYKGLKDGLKGPKPEYMKLLTKEQEIAIQKMIIDIMPDQLKLFFMDKKSS